MELTKRQLRKIRLRVAQPIYPIDSRLMKAAAKYDAGGGDIHSMIQNPSSHLIYRYLSELVIAILESSNDKKLKNMRILDWGGGKGYITYFLNQKGARATLYETDEFLHKSLWEEFNFDVKTTADGSLPFNEGTFDAVISFGVLEHVPYDYESLKEVNRVLKDSGLFLCFNLPNKASYIHKLAWLRGFRYHDRLYTRAETKILLKRAGFRFVGKPWFRQLLPKTHYRYRNPRLMERIDLLATNYTPLCFFAASIEFVARKQYTYTVVH